MSNKKRIFKKRNAKKTVSEKQNLENFIIAFRLMAKEMQAITLKLENIKFSNNYKSRWPSRDRFIVSDRSKEVVVGRSEEDFNREYYNYPSLESAESRHWLASVPKIIDFKSDSAFFPRSEQRK